MASGLATAFGGCAPAKAPPETQRTDIPPAAMPTASATSLNDGGAAAKEPAAEGDAGSVTIAKALAAQSSDAGTIRRGGASVGSYVPDTAHVVARMRSGFRGCYDRAVAKDPDHAGALMLEIEVDADGSVTKVRAQQQQGLSEALIRCVEAVARNAQFSPPEGGKATLTIPLKFQPKP